MGTKVCYTHICCAGMVIAVPFNQIRYFTRTVLSLTRQRCTASRTVYDFLKLFMPSEGALGVLPTIICCFFVVQFVLHHLYFYMSKFKLSKKFLCFVGRFSLY